jgi:hypothetical protein
MKKTKEKVKEKEKTSQKNIPRKSMESLTALTYRSHDLQ